MISIYLHVQTCQNIKTNSFCWLSVCAMPVLFPKWYFLVRLAVPKVFINSRSTLCVYQERSWMLRIPILTMSEKKVPVTVFPR